MARSNALLALALAAGFGGIVWHALSKRHGDLVTGKSGHPWRVALLGRTGDVTTWEIFAPAGSWGPHPELSVVRYRQTGSDTLHRQVLGVGDGTPDAMRAAALSDFGLPLSPGGPLALGTSG